MKLTGKVKVPVVGPVDKRALLAVGGIAAAFVGWKWWQARSSAAYDPEGVDPGFEDGGLLPGVAGAVRPDNGYGLPSDEPPSTDTYGFTGTTNSQWSQYVTTQLVQSDRWSYTDIVTALGRFLTNKALTTDQMAIVSAAIALAGYPPVGNFTIIPGGNTPVLVAPTGLSGTAVSDSAISLRWSAVAGADEYQVFRGSAAAVEVEGTATTITGLSASTSYGFQVAAVSSGGQVGPKSSTVTVKTNAKPTTPKPADPKPKPATPTKPKPKPKPTPSKKYPTRWKTVVNGANSNYSSIAQKYRLGISGEALYNYQFTSQANRPASTKAKLKKRGPNLIYAAGTTVLPYPK